MLDVVDVRLRVRDPEAELPIGRQLVRSRGRFRFKLAIALCAGSEPDLLQRQGHCVGRPVPTAVWRDSKLTSCQTDNRPSLLTSDFD